MMKKVRRVYKMTELGAMPIDWNIMKLRDVIKEFIVPMRDKPKNFSGSIPWCRIEDIEGKYLNDSKSCQYVNEETIKKMKLRIHPIGTVICSCSASLGVYAIVTRPLTTNQTFIGLFPTELVCSDYLYYTMNNSTVRLRNIASGTTILYISREKFEEFTIFIPPIIEQQKIADIISTVDERIENIESLIEKTDELKKGLMQRLLTKGIGHDRFKDTEIGKIPEAWKEEKIKNLSSFCSNGFVGTASPFYTDDNEATPYLMSNNVRANKIDERNVVKIKKEFKQRYPRSTIYEGDMLTVQSGHIGTSCIVPEKYNNTNCHALIITRFNEAEIAPLFISYYINSYLGLSRLSNIFVGTTIKHINVKDLIQFYVPVPDLNEQKQISLILSSVDEKINQYKSKKEKLQELKRGLMQKLLTGKIRVKV